MASNRFHATVVGPAKSPVDSMRANLANNAAQQVAALSEFERAIAGATDVDTVRATLRQHIALRGAQVDAIAAGVTGHA